MIENENDALYEEQESKLAARSSAFVEFLQRRGLLDGSKIDDEKIRQAKKEYIQRVHHNTRLLMENYRMIRWVLECCPDEIAAELDAPMGDLDALMDKIDLHLCLEDKRLEGRINAIAKTRVLMDRVNEALTILRRKPIDGQQLYDLLYVSYIQDEQLTNIDICHQLHMSSRTYYRLRREAFKIISTRLWSSPNSGLDSWIEILTLLEGI